MFISPMLLEKRDIAFSDTAYIFEPKFDGHRLIYSYSNGVTRLYTRHNNECTKQYPELLESGVDDGTILDGEVVVFDPVTGAVDFEAVMTRFQAGRTDSIKRLTEQLPVTFVVFDILKYRGRDLRGLPLYKRKELLSSVSFNNSRIIKTPYIEGAGTALFEDICSKDMEGIVCKRKDSLYVSCRSDAWLKIINWTYVDVWLTGYRKEEFGWLAAVDSGNGKLRPAGIIELGVKPIHKKAFYGVRDSITTGEDKNNVYIQPVLRAKVKTRNWTKAGLLRSPVFVDFAV
ncbi:ATP-dependent DNA ligase [Paenibacillus alvei]|uniref:ATP-dependent DNA ligase n=1 Tax=Paenibacillus alvei TaxID=44250 RepID=UPI00227FBA90|nr:RNA ligase family protein [Paenibacillus alvei]MCY9737946.1 ATP-dependent DNA ligase [Paenibacillus alvei]